MSAETMLELAARCEAATGADRELNELIAEAVGVRVKNVAQQTVYVHFGLPGSTTPLRYTASLDAAIALADPRALWAVGSMEDGPFARLCWPMPDGTYLGGYIETTASTPALALCAAALRAAAKDGAP